MKTNFKRAAIVLAAMMLVPTGCSKSAQKDLTNQDATEVLLQEDKVSSAIELVETTSVKLSNQMSVEEASIGSDFTDKVVSYLTPSVYIYANRDTDSTPVGIMLPNNEANIVEIEGDWTYVEYGGNYGYVKNESVLFGKEAYSIASVEGIESNMTIADNVLVYDEPDDTSNMIATLKKAEDVSVISEEQGYLLIAFDDKEGYVKQENIKETYDLTQAITVEAYEAMLEELRQEELRKQEEELKRQQEAEELLRQQREAAIQAGRDKIIDTVQGEAYNLTEEDIWLLACIVKYESGWQEYEGKLAVANVVLNRYKMGAGSIASVIYARGQFSGVSDGNGGPSQYFSDNYLNVDLNYRLPQGHADECMRAALEAASGINNIGDFRFFIGVNYADYSQFSDYKIIGGHCFYSR